MYEMFHILNCGFELPRILNTPLKFLIFQASLRNYLNYFHNWDDHSLLIKLDGQCLHSDGRKVL